MKKSFIGFYTIELLDISIVFAYVKSNKDFLELLNKKSNKDVSEFILKKLGKEFEICDNSSGVIYDKNSSLPVMIYIDSTYKYLDHDLVHETNHLIRRLSEYYGFTGESEFTAYLQTFLFKEFKKIIKKVNNK